VLAAIGDRRRDNTEPSSIGHKAADTVEGSHPRANIQTDPDFCGLRLKVGLQGAIGQSDKILPRDVCQGNRAVGR
jgi:hypothetical protein